MYDYVDYFNNAELYEPYGYINGLKDFAELWDDKIYSLEFEESISSGDTITFGETCSKYIKMKIDGNRFSSAKQFINSYIILRFQGAWNCPLGTFYVNEVEWDKNGNIITLTAYDKMALLNVEYVPTVTFPASCLDVVQDIATQFNFPYRDTNFISTGTPITNIKCTAREMLGYIAGLNGGNARFDRDDYFEIVTYPTCTDDNVIEITTEDKLFELGLIDEQYKITALVSGEGENEIKSGNGKAITFANPFMTQEILDTIREARLADGYSYNAGTVKLKANPCYEVGDLLWIKLPDTAASSYQQVPIMKQVFTYDGRLGTTITSYGMSDTTDVISNFKSDTVTLERNISKIESMQSTIIGATGGYYDLLLDANDSKPYGTAWWKDASKTSGWKFTYGGLGYFNTNTLQKIALTNDGSVLADNITANSIITNSFTIGKSSSDYAMSFDGSTGKITFGSGVSMSWKDITDTPSIPTKTSELTNDEGYITNGDIPSKTSDLTNDSGFINSTTATTITNNAIATANISADRITTGTLSADRIGAGAFNITGGSIQIDTGYDDSSIIKLTGTTAYTGMGTDGFYSQYNDNTWRCSLDPMGLYISDGSNSGTYTGLALESLMLNGHSFYVDYDNFMSSCTIVPEGSYNWDLGSSDYYWNNIYCYYVNQVSDRNLKENITPLTDLYVQLFDKLQPVTFKYKGGDRTHTGFISQDVETAMGEVGLTAIDFGGFCKDTITNEDGTTTEKYALRYNEFIALLTAKIKQLENRIEVLENGLSTND